jgi:hypothetical protein
VHPILGIAIDGLCCFGFMKHIGVVSGLRGLLLLGPAELVPLEEINIIPSPKRRVFKKHRTLDIIII